MTTSNARLFHVRLSENISLNSVATTHCKVDTRDDALARKIYGTIQRTQVQ